MVEKAADLARELGVFRAREFVTHGFPRAYLRRLQQRGIINRTGRGLYRHADLDFNENLSFVELAKRIPAGIICLYSALNFHQLGTQAPRTVWLAVPRQHGRPQFDHPPVRLRRFSPAAYAAGIEEHPQPGGTIRVYSVAKTVADCFKYRRKFGLDVCLEALAECLRQKRATVDELVHFGKICRVDRVMRPYIEAMT